MKLEEIRRQYRGDSVQTATPLDLVVLLGERALLDLDRAARAEAGGDLAKTREQLAHARAVVLELLASLDRERGGELVENLARLYVFAVTRLVLPARGEGVKAAREVLAAIVDGFRLVRRGAADGAAR